MTKFKRCDPKIPARAKLGELSLTNHKKVKISGIAVAKDKKITPAKLISKPRPP